MHIHDGAGSERGMETSPQPAKEGDALGPNHQEIPGGTLLEEGNSKSTEVAGQVANKPKKKGSTSLVIKEMPISTTIFMSHIRKGFVGGMLTLSWVCR